MLWHKVQGAGGAGGGGGATYYGSRGVFGGGAESYASVNKIDYITIATTGNAADFGDMTVTAELRGACSNGSRGVFGGGYQSSASAGTNTIDYVTIATTGNATDFGDLTVARYGTAACSNGTRGVFGGGIVYSSGQTAFEVNTIDYVTIATTGNATDFGDLTEVRRGLSACSNGTRGVFGGGYRLDIASDRNTIDYITIATTGNATDFGDLTVARRSLSACSNGTRGVFGGGLIGISPSTGSNVMDYVTIATTGNATDFGDLTVTRYGPGACSDGTRGVFGGGAIPATKSTTYYNTIDYVTISTTGNATDFGDLTAQRSNVSATSGS